MRQVVVTVLGFMSFVTSAHAASDRCVQRFESIVHRTAEARRLEQAAHNRGFVAEDGSFSTEDEKEKTLARQYLKIADRHHDAVEKMRVGFVDECLK